MGDGKPPARCFYCLSEHVSISICLDCRTAIERAKRAVEDARKQAEGWKRNYYRLMNERKRETRRGRP